MHSRTEPGQNKPWLPWLGFAAIAVIYLTFPTKNFFFDGIDFAYTIEQASSLKPSLVHPNHLIYNVVGWLFYRLALVLGFPIRAVAALQILNSILSVLSAYVVYLILSATLRSRYIVYCLTLLFAFSATWWKYSTDADAYIPSVLFLLISFYLALPAHKARPLLVALCYTVGLCLHQIAIVFFPVLVVAMLLQEPESPRRKRIMRAISFGVAAPLLTLTAYAWSFYLLTHSFQLKPFVRWSMSYAPDESFGFHPLDNLGFSVRGHFRLLVGGRLNAMSGLINPLIAVLIVIAIVLFLLFAYQLVRNCKRPGRDWFHSLKNDLLRRHLIYLCLLWISVYLVFLFFLLAHHTYYRLFYLPALIILVGLALDAYNSSVGTKRKYRLALFVAVLALANFLMLIFPYAHVEKNPPLALALELNQTWPRNTVIYYALPNADQSLVRYFTPGTTWKQLDPKQIEPLEAESREAAKRGGEVWLETTAIDRLSAQESTKQWLQKHAMIGNARSVITRAHNIRYVQLVAGETE